MMEEISIAKKECWNGRKSASQVTTDFEATECLLGLLKEKWESLNDSKTTKKQIWDVIANGLDEAGFIVRGEDKGQTCKTKWENLRKDYRSYIAKFQVTGSGASETMKKPKFFDSIEQILGSKNHSYLPPYVSDSLMKKQNPSKFQEIDNDGVIESTAIVEDNEQKTKKEKKKETKDSPISDDEIFMDSLDEKTSNDGIPERKKKRPSRSSKTEKVLQVFQDMRQESVQRHNEEKCDKQKRHEEKMHQSQQMIDVLKTFICNSSKKN